MFVPVVYALNTQYSVSKQVWNSSHEWCQVFITCSAIIYLLTAILMNSNAMNVMWEKHPSDFSPLLHLLQVCTKNDDAAKRFFWPLSKVVKGQWIIFATTEYLLPYHTMCHLGFEVLFCLPQEKLQIFFASRTLFIPYRKVFRYRRGGKTFA